MAYLQMQRLLGLLLLLVTVSYTVMGLDVTDTITSAGDNTRSGHMPNHNMDPNVVKSGNFGMLWRTKGKGNYNGFTEQFYAQPLIYTPPGQKQFVYAISQQNYVYRFDAVTGEILNYRQLMVPFLVSDLTGCNDISDCIGSTATGVIDPARGAWYVTTKTYVDQSRTDAQGRPAGRYYVHALDVMTLEEKPGFPVNLEGAAADNAPWRIFQGGIHHQRPALIQIGDWIYAGFASHCVQYNFTGWVIGWHAGTGELVTKYAMEGGKETNGIGGGIWMSGGGLASDNPGRMFFATGNGYASQLSDEPVPGRQPPTALEEAVVNMAISETGALTPVDFFMPWEKQDLDGMDKDLGTSGFILLEPGVFSTSKVSRIGCVAGKTGKLYFLNLNDLGGYQMGPNRKDAVLQVTQLPNAVFASAGTYPFEGGYVYVTPVGNPTIAFKFGQTAGGDPVFTEVGRTTESAAGRQGVGHSTITTMNGEPGTGILWIVDVEGVTLRAYGTMPVNGILPTLALLNSDSQTKFSRPSFGNGKVYVTSSTGYITAFGSPVNLGLNCSSPYDAGAVNVGNSTTVDIICKALAQIQVDSIDLDSPTHFSVSNLPTFPLTLAVDGIFSFKSTFNPKVVGPLSTNINVRTTNLGAEKFASNTPVVIRGKAISQNAVLKIQPNVLSFGEIVLGGEPTSQSFAIENVGLSPLQITSYQWSYESATGPFITPNSTDTVGAYTFSGLPAASGGTVPAESQQVVTVTFNPPSNGNWPLYLVITTTSGKATVGIFGTAGGAPKAKLEWQLSNGTWIEYVANSSLVFDGGAFRGQAQYRKFRLTNLGGTTLTTTISKPPVSGPLAAVNPLGSIAEGSQLAANKSEEATLICSPPKGQVNMDEELLTAVWTLNNNDPTFGKHVVTFECSAKTPQIGAVDENGQAYFRYLGCYKDADPARRMDQQLYSKLDNTNDMCIQACDDRSENFWFAATQYHSECWCGKKVPPSKVPDSQCSYLCSGDFNQYCGGEGILMSLFYDRRLWTPTNTTNPSSTSSAPTSTPTSADKYEYLGCSTEGTGGRALADDFMASASMTPQSCQTYCTGKGFSLSGVEYSTECYCGNVLSNGAALGSTNCNMVCPGDESQICGGPGALSVYKHLPAGNSSSSATPTPTEPPVSSSIVSSSGTATPTPTTDFELLGCAFEGIGGRALTGGFLFSDTMTPEMCQGHCRSLSLPLAGIEYSKECYCGASLSNGATLGSPNCNMPCGGDSSKTCGGPNALSLYRYVPPGGDSSVSSSTTPTPTVPPSSSSSSAAPTSTDWTYRGCLTEGTGGRALTGAFLFLDTMTPQKCQDHCKSKNLKYSGIEYSKECYCGAFLANGATLGSTNCNMACGGDSTQICGGPNALSLFEYTPAAISSSADPVVSSSAPPPSSTVAPSSTTSASPTAANTDWSYRGCLTEGTNGRALTGGSLFSDTMTPQKCQAHCKTLNLKYSGVEYSKECYCGASISNGATLESTNCNMACGGDSSQICGGPNALSFYEYTPPAASSSAAGAVSSSEAPVSQAASSAPASSTASASVSPTATASTHAYIGCAEEPSAGRALTLSSMTSPILTPALCQEFCSSKKLPLSGVEYGTECYCGISLANNATLGSSSCTMPCGGDNTKLCGGPGALSVYNWTSWAPEPQLTGWTDIGCWKEGVGERALQGASMVRQNMTMGTCVGYCNTGGWKVAGTEYGSECYCGNDFASSVVKAEEKECAVLCGGGGGVCGGGSRLSVYRKNEAPV